MQKIIFIWSTLNYLGTSDSICRLSKVLPVFSSTFCLSDKVDLIQNCPWPCCQCLFINEEFLRSKIITNITINNFFMLSVDFSHTLLSSLLSQIILVVYTMHSQYRKVEFQKLFENQRNWCYLVIQICQITNMSFIRHRWLAKKRKSSCIFHFQQYSFIFSIKCFYESY